MLETNYLIVDDSKAVVDTLKISLVQLGIPKESVWTAETPKAALKAFQTHRPGVVFMDLELGGESGDKAARLMLKERPATKVIVMTGFDRRDPRVRDLISAGAYEFLEKPLRIAKLQELMSLLDSESKGLRRVT